MTDTGSKQHSAFVTTSSKETLTAWDEVLKLQVDLFALSELEYLNRLNVWRNGQRVLDVGCGNGDFTARLINRFPDKRFIGIDASPELIACAVASHRGDSVAFSVEDFFDFNTECKVDIILMRFVVQHLPDFNAILERADLLLRGGGLVLIVEPSVENSRNIPATPLFEALIGKFEHVRGAAGLMRQRLQNPGELLIDCPSWSVIRDDLVRSSQIVPTSIVRMHRLYRRWTEMFHSAGLFSWDYDAVYRELDGWLAAVEPRSEIALRAIWLQRSIAAKDHTRSGGKNPSVAESPTDDPYEWASNFGG